MKLWIQISKGTLSYKLKNKGPSQYEKISSCKHSYKEMFNHLAILRTFFQVLTVVEYYYLLIDSERFK